MGTIAPAAATKEPAKTKAPRANRARSGPGATKVIMITASRPR